jgi:hypothetical protein
MDPNQTLKEFCHMHGINVVNQNKRAHKITKMNTMLFQFADDYNKFLKDYVNFETETLYTVEISESEFKKIAEFESQVFNHMREKGHYDMFNAIMEQKQKEKYLKEKYPAVKKAYEQYSLMLKLAESGEL